jgi:hypothetical protein
MNFRGCLTTFICMSEIHGINIVNNFRDFSMPLKQTTYVHEYSFYRIILWGWLHTSQTNLALVQGYGVQFLCNYSVGLIVHVTNKILAIVQEYGVAGQAILFMKWTSINLSVICKDSIFSDWHVKLLAFSSEVRKICAPIRHLGS